VLPPSLLRPLASRPLVPPSDTGMTGGLGRRRLVGPASARLLGLMGGVLNPSAPAPRPLLLPPPLLLLWGAAGWLLVRPPPARCCCWWPLGLLTVLPPPLVPLPTCASSPPPPPPPNPAASGIRPQPPLLLLLLARRMGRTLLPPPLVLPPLVVLVDARPLQLLLRCVARAGLDTAEVDVEAPSQLKVKLPSPVEQVEVLCPAACAAAAAAAAARGVPDWEDPDSALPRLLPVGVLGLLPGTAPCTAIMPVLPAPVSEVRPCTSMDMRLLPAAAAAAAVGEGSCRAPGYEVRPCVSIEARLAAAAVGEGSDATLPGRVTNSVCRTDGRHRSCDTAWHSTAKHSAAAGEGRLA
jgi:hypothetical protein